MINGLEGIPGSGKSYEACVFHVLHSLQKGRKVITNLPLVVERFASIDPAYADLIELRTLSAPVLGTWNAAAVDDKGNGNAFALHDDKIFGHVFDEKSAVDNGVFGSVWDYYTTWKHSETGQGPLFIIDECHVPLPTLGTNNEVVEWFKLHRHFNVDVLLCTQNFRDMNQPIARLLGMLVKVRSADIIGKKGAYIRKVHSGYRGVAITTEERKYKPEFFSLYKSHSQGNSVAESSATDVKPTIVYFKRFTNVFLIFTAVYCVWAGYRFFHKPEPGVAAAHVSPMLAAMVPAPAASAGVAPSPVIAQGNSDSQKMVAMPDGEIPEPYASKGLHVTGRMTIGDRVLYTFAVSSANLVIAMVTSDDLKRTGYVWQPLTDCAGTLRWKSSAKAVTCDAPVMSQGSQNSPVVITMPAGGTIPTARSDGIAVMGKPAPPPKGSA